MLETLNSVAGGTGDGGLRCCFLAKKVRTTARIERQCRTR